MFGLTGVAPPADHSKPFTRAALLLTGLAWTLPFLQPYHRFPLVSFYSEWLAFALGLAAAALMLANREPWRGLTVPAVLLAPAGLALVIAAQVALGRVPYPEQALTATLYLLWAALLVLLGGACRRALGLSGIAPVLAWFLLAGAVASAVVGLLQHWEAATPLDFLVARRAAQQVYGNLGQPNHFAAYLAMGLASAGYLHARRRLHGGAALALAALLLTALALSGSRSAWLHLGTLLALALGLHLLRRGEESRRLLAFAAWLLPGFVLALWVASLPLAAASGAPLASDVDRLFRAAEGVGPRLQLWREAWLMFLGAPLLGAGWGQFAWHHYLYLAQTGATAAPGLYHHAHNLVLHLMAETGALGALAVIAPLLAWLASLRRVELDTEWWWLLALLAVIGVHSLLEYPLWYSYFLGMAAFLLGLGDPRGLAVRAPGLARLPGAVAVAVGCLNLAAVLPSYRGFERLVFVPESRAPRAADEAGFAKAVADLYREPLLVPYLDLAVAYGLSVDEDGLPEKLALAQRAARFAPVAVVVYRHALLLALAGDVESARAQLGRALRVYPEEAAEVRTRLEALALRYPGRFESLVELVDATRAAAERATAR